MSNPISQKWPNFHNFASFFFSLFSIFFLPFSSSKLYKNVNKITLGKP